MKNLLKISFLFVAFGLLAVSCKNKTAGEKATTGAASKTTATASSTAKTMNVNTGASQVLWVGSKATGKHNGSINVSGGELSVENNQIVSGKFTLDMNSITCLDLKAGEGKEDLEGHLKGMGEGNEDHFFNVKKYPQGTFVISKVDALPAGGEATHNITGNLTLKGQTKSITFPANVVISGDKVSAVTPSFKINRTEWGINYGSKSIFKDLKDKIISDDIALNINLQAS